MDKKITFDKKASDAAKGIAIILMLMHHLFGCFPDWCKQYGVHAGVFDFDTVFTFSVHAKVCVAVFVFITAYGITRQYNLLAKKKENVQLKLIDIERFALSRYIKLILNFGFVYILALATSFLRDGGIKSVYFANGTKTGIVYLALDALGLANYFGTHTLNETWWYMSIAILFIFLIPICIRLYKSYGILIVACGFFIFYLGISQNNFTRYLFCVVLGIMFAERDIFEKLFCIGAEKKGAPVIHFLKLVLCIVLFAALLLVRNKLGFTPWIDAATAFVICWGCMELVGYFLKWLQSVLAFLGKHSMNIFLIHTLIFEYYFSQQLYGLQNCWVMLVLLLLGCLAISIGIEWLKKTTRYTKLVKLIMRRCY